jgi:hypothetical protein
MRQQKYTDREAELVDLSELEMSAFSDKYISRRHPKTSISLPKSARVQCQYAKQH